VVVVGCFGVVSEVVVGKAEVGAGLRLCAAIVMVVEQGEGLLAVVEGLVVGAEPGVACADGGEGSGFSDVVTGGLEEGEGLPGVVQRFAVAVS
jgi:hypothetical protein